jgi:hypothetical protein
LGGHPFAQIGHVRLYSGIVVQTDALGYILRCLLPHLNFLRFRNEGQLALPSHRIPGATEQSDRQTGAEQQRAGVSQRSKSRVPYHRASFGSRSIADLSFHDRLSTGQNG